jgi:hypothetical protein
LAFTDSLNYVKERAGVTGRFHDTRHTLVTELAESGAGDQTDYGHRRSRFTPDVGAVQSHQNGSKTPSFGGS